MHLVQMVTQIKEAGAWIRAFGSLEELPWYCQLSQHVMADVLEMIFQWYYLQDIVGNRLLYILHYVLGLSY